MSTALLQARQHAYAPVVAPSSAYNTTADSQIIRQNVGYLVAITVSPVTMGFVLDKRELANLCLSTTTL